VRIVIAIVLGAAALAACERDSEVDQTGQGDSDRPVAGVVARVGGRVIGLSEVEALMEAEELGAEAALQKRVDQELLAQEAERLGFTLEREGERMVERLMVRTMLHDFEKENGPDSISDEELREDYALYIDKFRIPERRRSWHILVKDSGDAAKSLAESILRELRQAKDPRTVFDRYAGGGPEGTELEILTEDLPAITTSASFQKPYKDAVFAAKSTGPLNEVVGTSYGWHAIVVAEIVPAEQRSIEEVEDESRDRLSQAKRALKLVRTVQALQAEGLVEYDAEVVDRLLSMAGLPERAE
jgi:parvulin-like peptidyl-prolyl isomerase